MLSRLKFAVKEIIRNGPRSHRNSQIACEVDSQKQNKNFDFHNIECLKIQTHVFIRKVTLSVAFVCDQRFWSNNRKKIYLLIWGQMWKWMWHKGCLLNRHATRMHLLNWCSVFQEMKCVKMFKKRPYGLDLDPQPRSRQGSFYKLKPIFLPSLNLISAGVLK